jgi:hypothetical protein
MSLSAYSFFKLIMSFCRRADTDVLSLVHLKRVALSAHETPSEPHSQPPYAELLLVQVEEGLVMAIEVEEIAAPLPPVAAAVTGEERSVSEMSTPQARLEPLAGAGSGDDDVVMVLADQGTPPPPPTREHEAAMPEAPETLAAAAAPSIGVQRMCRRPVAGLSSASG